MRPDNAMDLHGSQLDVRVKRSYEMLAMVIGSLVNLEKHIEAPPEKCANMEGSCQIPPPPPTPDDPFLGDDRAHGPLRDGALDLSRWGHNPKKKACHKPRSHHRAQTPFFTLPF